jgi:hypothetical protein
VRSWNTVKRGTPEPRADIRFDVKAGSSRIPRSWLRAGASVLAGACIFALVTRGELTFFPEDSLLYLSAAQTLLQHHELATGIAYDASAFEAAVAQGRLPPPLEPLTAWPPGYPLAIAAAAWCTGIPVVEAALVVNFIFVVAIILLVAWLGRRAGGDAVGFVAATMIALLPFFSATVREAMSEAQFTALILAALALLILWAERPDERAAHLHLACLVGVAATYTRYIGVSFFVVAAVATAHCVFARRRAGLALHAAAGLAGYVLLMVPLALRNMSHTGHLSGAVRYPSELGLFSNLTYLARGFFDALPLVRTVVPGPWDLFLSAGPLVIVTIGCVDWNAIRIRALALGVSPVSTRLIGLFVLVYCSLLVILRSHTSFEIITPRLLFPALVPAVILAVAAGRFLIAPERRALVAILWGIGSVAATLAHSPVEKLSLSVSSHAVQNHPTIRMARAHLDSAPNRHHLIFADDFYAVHFATGAPVYRLPPLANLSALVPALRTSDLAGDLLFVIGPPGLRASLSESDAAAYARTLDDLGVSVRRGSDYGVWCVSTMRN